MNKLLAKIQKIGIVPVVVLEDAKDAIPLAKALCEGGIPCAEVTFRTDAAEESIRKIKAEFPDMLVGAGTVLTIDQVDRAVDAGAQFIVSPGLNPAIVKHCIEKGMPIVPGCTNPSDIEQALGFGLDVIKFFPAEASGGLKMIKSLAAPYTNLKFMPTGGIGVENICDYLAFDKIIACGGSWMVPQDLVAAGAFDEIKTLTKEAVAQVIGFDIKHVGFNSADAKEAEQFTDQLCNMFNLNKNEGNKSFFAGTGFEIMKSPHFGKNGHIGISTNSVERARFYLESKGITFNEETATYKNDKLTFIYLEKEVGGFAFHLIEK